MTRKETRDLIDAGIQALGNQIQFNSGRISEFDSQTGKEYPFIWLESLSAATTVRINVAYTDDWDVKLHIAKKDQPGSSPEEYESIIDDCDYIAQQLTKQYMVLLASAGLVTISSTTRTPFIHKLADDTSGVVLAFKLTSPDTTNVCQP